MSKKEVNRALNLIDKKVQIVLDMTAQGIVNVAKRLCVVGKYTTGQVGGRLRGSLSWSDESKTHAYEKGGQGTGATDSDKIDNAPNRNTRWIGTNVDYGPPVEFGTYKQTAQPYLRPAAKQAPRIFKQVVAQVKGLSGTIR